MTQSIFTDNLESALNHLNLNRHINYKILL